MSNGVNGRNGHSGPDSDEGRDNSMPGLAAAKQRASILWLLSKACHEVPPELQEPYYKDHDGEDRLKPTIVQAMASAEMYCLVLANIYADPAYNTLGHKDIIQVLARKGIYVNGEGRDTALTETVLVQTAPIKMVMHLTV